MVGVTNVVVMIKKGPVLVVGVVGRRVSGAFYEILLSVILGVVVSCFCFFSGYELLCMHPNPAATSLVRQSS